MAVELRGGVTMLRCKAAVLCLSVLALLLQVSPAPPQSFADQAGPKVSIVRNSGTVFFLFLV